MKPVFITLPLFLFTLQAQSTSTTTPIQHVVVMFQENVSFDHYFATYPVAANNSPAEPRFTSRRKTALK